VGAGGECGRRLVDLLNEALSALGATNIALRARVLARLSTAIPQRDELVPQRQAWSAEAVDLARRAGDRQAVAYALDARFMAIWVSHGVGERLALADEIVRLAIETGDRERELQVHHWRFIAAMERGDVAAADTAADAQERLATELRQPLQRWYTVVVRGTRAVFDGRFDEGERLIREALQIGSRAQREMAASFAVRQTFALRRHQGRLHELELPLRQLVPRLSVYPVMLALTYAEGGRLTEARALFEELALDGFRQAAGAGWWIYSACLLAEVCAALADRGRAAVLYDRLTPYAGQCAVSGPTECIVAVARSLGVLAAALGRRTAAARHFEQAIALNARMGGRPWMAHTQVDCAAMLLDPAHGTPADRPRALALLDEASAAARELGMARLAERVDGLLGLSHATTSAAPAKYAAAHARPDLGLPEGLTPREIDVLQGIAAGRSNQQIADDLVLSVRTVERHIAGIYGKIGASGKPARAVATAFALTHGLVRSAPIRGS
jgi:ATP/maltotriose-dependent transcriptional regulator MalT